MILETKQDLLDRDKIMSTIEDITAIPREYWETYRTKKPTEVLLRSIYIYMVYKFLGKNKSEIRDIVGLKNHASVSKAIDDVENLESNTREYKLLQLIIDNYGQQH